MKGLVSILILTMVIVYHPAQAQEFAPKDTVSVELKWYHSFQFAGYYAAQTQGFYEEEGLFVNIINGSLLSKQVQNVVNGDVEFAIYDSGLMIEAYNGMNVVAINAIYQYSPYILAARADRGYTKLSDLANAKIMAGSKIASEEMSAWFNEQGISTDSIDFVSFDINMFLEDESIDVIHTYVSDPILTIEQNPLDVDIFYPWRYNVDFYGDILFTSQEYLENNHDIVDRFNRSTLKGWQYARDHESEIIDYTLTLPGVIERGLTKEKLEYEAEVIWAYAIPDHIPLGFMSDERWQKIGEYYINADLMDEIPDLNEFLIQPQLSVFDRIFPYLKYIIAVLSAVVLTVVLWIYFLRREVKRRTDLWLVEHKEKLTLEEKYQYLITNIHDCTFTIDSHGVFSYLSPRVEAITGFTPEEYINVSPPPFVREKDAKELSNRLNYRINKNIEDRGTIPLVHKNGSAIWVNSSSQVKKTKTGEIIVVGTFRDITQRKLAEKALQRSETLNKNIIDNISECVLSIDKSGSITYISHSIEKINGLSPTEMIGKSFFGIVYNDDKESVFNSFYEINDETTTTFRFRIQHRHTEGLRWVEANFLVSKNYHQKSQILGSLRDVSEKKFAFNAMQRSEQRFRTLSENSPVGIFMFMPNEYVFVNQKYKNIFGASNQEILGTEIDYSCIHEEDRGHLMATIHDLITGKLQKSHHIYRGRTYGGRPIVLEYYTTSITVAGQRILFGTVIDISEEHKAKNRLLKMIEEKNILLAEVHHRVKNNMALITSLIELQRLEIENDIADIILQEAQLRIHTIATIHEQLYDHESFIEIPFKSYLLKLIDNVVHTINTENSSINIETEIDDINININYCIPVALFINEALTNCLKHAFKGRECGSVQVNLKQTAADQFYVSIADNGIGLSNKPDHYNSLGFTIIRSLADQVSGNLEINRIAEVGTSIELQFNVARGTIKTAGNKVT